MNTNIFPCIAMVFAQFLFAVASITMKIGFANGLHQLVFVVYRNLISTILFCPFALVFERKDRPKLTFVAMMKIFVLSFLGSTIHLNAYCYGLAYTSATVASALNCLTPSLTFLVAFLLRMEKVKITSSKGQAKGIVVSGLTYYLVLWAISKRGPVFAAMFSPLQLPIVGVFSAIVFNERLHIGSIIGALIIIAGLYCVLWGQSKDDIVKLHESQIDILKDDKSLKIVINNDTVVLEKKGKVKQRKYTETEKLMMARSENTAHIFEDLVL
ncbi:WAT1-related protein, partial [Tanacetum coccineum]